MNALSLVLPETLLGLAIVLGTVLEVGSGRRHPRIVAWFMAMAMLLTLFLSIQKASSLTFLAPSGAMFFPDVLGTAVRILALAGGLFAVVAATGSRVIDGEKGLGEFSLLVAGSVVGAMLLASATNLLSFYVSLEFLSLSGYALAGLRARSLSVSEASMKYVLFGGISSAVALFGMSHLYGLTGTLDLPLIGQVLTSSPLSAAYLVPVLLLGAAFAYKLALVPFHFWSPDVYEGCPTLAAGFLSTVPKAAGFVALVHMIRLVFPGNSPWANAVALAVAGLGILTMMVGGLLAVRQSNAKRILAYSSIANAGYMLLALAVGTRAESDASLLAYLLVYLVSNFGAFLALDHLESDGTDSSLEDLAGSWKRHPFAVAGLALCLFSLAGIPPLAGFVAKWNLLRAAFASQGSILSPVLLAFAVVLLVNSVLLAFAYLRILRAVAVEESTRELPVRAYQPSPSSHLPLLLAAFLATTLGMALPFLDRLQVLLGR